MPRKARKKSDRGERESAVSRGRNHLKRDVGAVLLFIVGVISLLGFFDAAGGLGHVLLDLYRWLIGGAYWLFPFVWMFSALVMLNASFAHRFLARSRFGFFLFLIAFVGLLHIRLPFDEMLDELFGGAGGGVIGFLIAYPLMRMAGFWAALIILSGLGIIGALLLFEVTLADARQRLNIFALVRTWWWSWRLRKNISGHEESTPLVGDDAPAEDASLAKSNDEGIESAFTQRPLQQQVDSVVQTSPHGREGTRENLPEGEQKPLFQVSRRKHPKIDLPLDLLQGKAGIPQSGDIEGNKHIIEQTLAHFGIQIEMGAVSVGPTVTQYTFRPAEGVKLSRITALANDLALALAAHPIRIEAPIPNKSLVGVEVPNQRAALVPLKDIIDTQVFKKHVSSLALGIGKDVSGSPYIVDLAEMPHLLIAGATGSGKSVMINAIIVSLLYRNQADALKFIMVDPKRVELVGYNHIPHLLTPVITDVEKTINALRWVVGEMDRRFDLLSHSKKRNIAAYNTDPMGDPLPYIVVVIDELADLMATAPAEIEAAIVRLAQMARAVGIHLILATQRPSVDVITGLIKANITARIAFSVASLIDSRTILDASGAEKLVGRGDMLFVSATVTKPKRLQGSYLADTEIERVVAYLKSKDKPEYLDDVVKGHEKFDANRGGGGSYDPLFVEARELVVTSGKASTSFLQRRLRLGYARAARLMDLLEEAGVVGPPDGAKQREVHMTPHELAFSDTESGDKMPQHDEQNVPQSEDAQASADSDEFFSDDSERDSAQDDLDRR